MDISQMNSLQLNELRRNLIRNIMNTNCNILNIDHRHGCTSYIDFIKQKELEENTTMKGNDDFNRPFIIFKAEIMYNDLNIKKQTSTTLTISTFTTFFQRYSDDSLLWHSCGHDGPLLFDTCGGANITQLKLLDDLFKNGFVDLTSDMNYEELKLYLNYEEPSLKPIKIQLGHSLKQLQNQ